MRTRRLAALASLAAAALLLLIQEPAVAAGPSHPAERSPSQPVYLALGDSVAAGVGAQPGGGYVPLLRDTLREDFTCMPGTTGNVGCSQLSLVDLSKGGATTTSLLATQLPPALTLLEDRNQDANPRNDVTVITLTIGGNDVFSPVIGACVFGAGDCMTTVQAVLGSYAVNLDLILSQLRAAAGPQTTIVTTAYYNPLPACQLAASASLADLVLESPWGLNAITEQTSARYGAEVADAYGQLTLDDYVGGSDCLHPDDSGHAKLAAIFAHNVLD